MAFDRAVRGKCAGSAKRKQEDPMSIWGRRDSEPPAGEAHESQSPAQAPDEPELQAQDGPGGPAGPQSQAGPGTQADEPAPAFWRAQGEVPEPFERSPADAPPLTGTASPDGAPAPDGGGAPGGIPAPAGSGAAQAPDDMVVLDGATAVKDPALTGTAVDDAGMAGAEPVPGAHEPVVPGPAPPEAAPPEAGVPEAGVPEAGVPPQPPGTPQAAGTPPQAVPAAAADVPAGAAASHAGISAERWSEIMATFVDDPRGSVKMAAATVAEAIDEFVDSVRARQRALESSWHGTGTDTEQLRTALREYRRFWHQVQELDPAGKTGA
jgi:hypothetical protein